VSLEYRVDPETYCAPKLAPTAALRASALSVSEVNSMEPANFELCNCPPSWKAVANMCPG